MTWSDNIPDVLPGESAEAYLARKAAQFPRGVTDAGPVIAKPEKSQPAKS